MSRKMTGIVKTFDRKSGKGFIIPSDGRKEVQVHISAFTPRDAEGNDSNLLIVFYVQIMPDDFVMQLHRF
ncbi:cold shock domain-containing protein [Escherichia coli]|uniref:cold shock domain-containing protein n=1 Tax=Escherichia coli TaxID=562 RepID=UPI003D366426